MEETIQKWLDERSHEQLKTLLWEQCQCNCELSRVILDLATHDGAADLIARIVAQANNVLSPAGGHGESSLQSMLAWSMQLNYLMRSQQAHVVCAILEQIIHRLGELYELSINNDWEVVCLTNDLQQLHAQAWIQDGTRHPSALCALLDEWGNSDGYGIMDNVKENYAAVFA